MRVLADENEAALKKKSPSALAMSQEPLIKYNFLREKLMPRIQDEIFGKPQEGCRGEGAMTAGERKRGPRNSSWHLVNFVIYRLRET